MTPDGHSSRRSFLRRGAALAVAGVTAGCQFREEERTETARPTESPTATATARERLEATYGDYETVVNVVDAGARPDGSARIDPVLERVVADDTLVFFPSGTYRLGSFLAEGLSNAAFVAESPGAVNVVPAEPAAAIGHLFLRFHAVSDFLIDGFTLDYTADGHGGVAQVIGRGGFTARNLRIRGKMPDEELPDTPAAFRFDVRDGSATATVENVRATDGGHDGGNAVGIYVGKDHAGTLEFVDCVVEGFPNNGLYASAPGRDERGFRGRDGTVHVRGGRYANNNIANVRLGSTDSTARDVRIVVDERPPTHAGALNARGLRIRNKSGQVVENCEIVLGPRAGYGFGGLVLHPNAGGVTVRDTTIRVDRDRSPAVRVLDDGAPETPPGPAFENVAITGAAATGWAVDIAGRRDVTFDDCTVRGTGAGRNGVSFTSCEDCAITGGEIDVPGVPLRSRRSTVQTRNLRMAGSPNDEPAE